MSTYEFIQSLFSNIPEDSQHVSHLGFVVLILSSALISIACAYLYLFFFDKNATGSKVYRAFPLIGPAITCIFLTVQFSLPLSLGLLGALSIVRFRTPIKEPEEIGFILLLIGCSLSVATFNLSFAVILLIAAFITLWLLKYFYGFNSDSSRISLLHIETAADDTSGAQIADSIQTKLENDGIRTQLVSINQRDQAVYITLRLKNHRRSPSQAFDGIKRQHPNAVISFQGT